MTLKRKIGYLLFAFTTIVVLIVLFVVIRYLGTDASEMNVRGKVFWQTSIREDLNKDGRKEHIILSLYDNEGSKRGYLEVEEGIFNKKELELTGFEDDLAFCPQKFFEDDGQVILCLFGEVGVHSENIQFVNYEKFRIIPIYNNEGNRLTNISCDLPFFEVRKDGTKTLAYFDNRNYDKNPLNDIIRSYYYLEEGAFRFIKSEEIVYQGSIK